MNKLRFSNRLKFFKRHPSSPTTPTSPPCEHSFDVGRPRSPCSQSLDDVGDLKSADISNSNSSDDVSNVSNVSNFSTETDSSINSKDRFTGPIDSDTLRKYRWKVRKVRSEGASARVLPKIVESPSSATYCSILEKSLNGMDATSSAAIAEGDAFPRAVGDDDAQQLTYTIPSQCSSGETQESNFINGSDATWKLDRTSPSSVIHMLNSSYPVEIDMEGSHSGDISARIYPHLAPDEQSKLMLPELSNDHPNLVTFDGHANTADQVNALISSPKVMSSDAPSPSIVLATVPSNAIGSDQCGIPIKGPTSSINEFLILKKVAEKNEFKMVVALGNKKNPTALGNILSSLSSSSSDGTVRGKLGDCDESVKITDEIHESNAENQLEHAATKTIGPANPFIERPTVSSPLPQELSSQETSLTLELEYEKMNQISDSFESDCSSYSSLASIGDISICDETKRLIEAHILYAEDAKTNLNHPARQKKSAMRTGSVFRNGCQLKQPELLSSDLSVSIVTEAPSTGSVSQSSVKTVKKSKLTWYDDKVNRTKPFSLRTDESFDVSTISKALSISKGITRYNVMDQFIGDFINGICHARGNVDFDISEQEEI
ncbi:hypothetical protein ACHAXA_007923 [Cyclostephanos tholiformis]|uniref:Uncharacterized protein n=1 Tax=Cyclostephanos tholiformis TaxID=382380 RepID=A0ABD3SH98_9STRA